MRQDTPRTTETTRSSRLGLPTSPDPRHHIKPAHVYHISAHIAHALNDPGPLDFGQAFRFQLFSCSSSKTRISSLVHPSTTSSVVLGRRGTLNYKVQGGNAILPLMGFLAASATVFLTSVKPKIPQRWALPQEAGDVAAVMTGLSRETNTWTHKSGLRQQEALLKEMYFLVILVLLPRSGSRGWSPSQLRPHYNPYSMERHREAEHIAAPDCSGYDSRWRLHPGSAAVSQDF